MEEKEPQRGWDAGPILLLFLILMVGIFLAALLHFTGGFDLSALL